MSFFNPSPTYFQHCMSINLFSLKFLLSYESNSISIQAQTLKDVFMMTRILQVFFVVVVVVVLFQHVCNCSVMSQWQLKIVQDKDW